MEITLTSDQKDALDFIIDWQKYSNQQLKILSGFAGTGKTTLIRFFKETLPFTIRVAFCAFTGKASSVLAYKLKNYNCFAVNDYCGTVHSLIYEPVVDDNGDIIEWKLKKSIPYDLIVLDEASMINEFLFEDLKSYNKPILAVGDCGQLPPIDGKLNLMKRPDISLIKIHRQAENDPIIHLSLLARNDGFIPYKKFSDKVRKITKKEFFIEYFVKNVNFQETIILCGFNKTRVLLNKNIRNILNKQEYVPEIDDRVICLKNNPKAKNCPIYNGTQGTIISCLPSRNGYKAIISVDNESMFYKGTISDLVFNNEKGLTQDIYEHYLDYWDYGYCISVHKSQGSEWKTVLLFEEVCDYWTGDKWKQWLYTAITRAKEELIIVGQR